MSDDRSTIQELLAAHKKRLQALEIQAARYGIDTPAHITNEIADLNARIAVLQQQLNSAPSHGSAAAGFRVWVVDQLHRGDHLTITNAISAASPGDRILVRPGVYDEALVLDKPLELIGEGEPGDVLIRASGANVIRFDCVRGLVKNLTLRQIQGDAWAVSISRGRLDLEDCDISSVGNGAVLIKGNAHPRLRRNRIHDNQGNGVYIKDNAQGLIEENDLFNHRSPAVGIDSGASPILRKNRIHDNQSNGAFIDTNAQGLLEENDIFNHSKPAVVIKNGASPILRKNRIHDNQSNGAFIDTNAQGLLEENDIFNHGHSAVYIDNGASPILRKNRIHDNQSHGVYIDTNAQGLIEENDIFNHSNAAVVIDNGSSPILRKNRIHDNQSNGVYIDTNARGLIEENDIFNHSKTAVVIKNGASPTLRKNRIHDNQSNGVSINTNAQSLLEDNQIFRHHHPSESYPAVIIKNGARPTLRRNHIYQNKSNGIWIKEGGGGTFEYNTLHDNVQGNWDIEQDCLRNVTRTGNTG